jgi:hypothetical protein
VLPNPILKACSLYAQERSDADGPHFPHETIGRSNADAELHGDILGTQEAASTFRLSRGRGDSELLKDAFSAGTVHFRQDDVTLDRDGAALLGRRKGFRHDLGPQRVLDP